MRLLVLHGFSDGVVVWLILGDVKFYAALRLSSVRRDRMLDLIFFLI